MTKNIGIIGAGVAGLHLGLYLVKHGVDTTIYTNTTADEVRDGRIMNSVAHLGNTRKLEADLGVNHWDDPKYTYRRHYHYNGWSGDRWHGDFTEDAHIVDYRIVLPTYMEDFRQAGGTIVYRDLSAADIQGLSDVHDLVVVSTGKGEIGAMFPKRPELSPYHRPQRQLAVGFWKGVPRRDPNGVEISIQPGVGELLALPMYSFTGEVMALLFESVPGGEQEVLTQQRYHDDPAAYRKLTLDILKRFHPSMYERVIEDEFELQSDKDILQGGFPPVFREDYVRLPNGKFLISLGDLHMTVDPIQAQGANSATQSARVVGECIVEDDVFDELFATKVARRRAERLEASTRWVNTIIELPTPQHVAGLLENCAHNQQLANEYSANFNDPIKQLDLLGTPERVEAAVARTAAMNPATADA